MGLREWAAHWWRMRAGWGCGAQVIVLTGQTYERSAITHWVDALKRKNKPPTCPTTRTVPPRTPSR
jgi:hypothetical protein